jgi:hypothetical protein
MFPHSLRRRILILVGVKAVALAAIYFAFFAPGAQPANSRTEIQNHILDTHLDRAN